MGIPLLLVLGTPISVNYCYVYIGIIITIIKLSYLEFSQQTNCSIQEKETLSNHSVKVGIMPNRKDSVENKNFCSLPIHRYTRHKNRNGFNVT